MFKQLAILSSAALICGCAALDPFPDCPPDKKVERKIFEKLAADVQEYCEDFESMSPSAKNEFVIETNREIFQITWDYDSEPEKRRGHLITINCSQLDDYPDVDELPESVYDTGWRPGSCPSQQCSDKGCAPAGHVLEGYELEMCLSENWTKTDNDSGSLCAQAGGN